ncbi:DsbE family thiol:disulfide interchange protein [Kaistia dalseonensis]|uniref:Cytochrome c biogenesis protein CcmG/thiol:disulfide interchange protein DsbE n=1 Tax=Kaistia dalseonensis TaxID=410840 RepID=A0ABU0H534_9HYPH|nr:DsbE family thiol:disulfide interchange protein [Kaistia dalseonensis]MCX5494821.1 DsbE family thiol:disulfide interchange protein [Kaistia dalseonensis]MDQ0437402.1 cytochrome c biogenesis protein CcmG/thiol:disulfide interchange protein DsbE [Kaistia dalseonensis]
MSAESANRPAKPPRSFGRKVAIAAPLVLFGLVAIVFLVKLEQGGDPSIVPSALVGRPAPATDLPPLAGSGVPGLPSSLFGGNDDGNAGGKANGNPGKPTLVNVWASWCVPCREEHPVLETLARDPRIRLVGINYKDQPENAARFLGQLGNPFSAIGVDKTGRTAIDWGVYGVPETFLVGPDGIIRYKFIGPLSPESLAKVLMPEIEKLIAPSATP